MPFTIVRNDITNMQVDAIVNTANPRPVIGSGTDAAIHAGAGPELLEARKKVGVIHPGNSAVTPAFNLDARFVIHTVGPVWQGGYFGEEKWLRSCYDSALSLARELKCESIAFPLISTGVYCFPKDQALKIAIAAFSDFLLETDMQIYLVVFGEDSYRLSEKLFQNVASYIDEHYVQQQTTQEYASFYVGSTPDWDFGNGMSGRMDGDQCECSQGWIGGFDSDWEAEPQVYSDASWSDGFDWEPEPMEAPRHASSLEDLLKNTDAGFSETLLKLIDKSGKKDSEIYRKAGLTKQHFSKIRNNPHYQPTKPTAIALALALELDLEATKDLIGRAGYTMTNSSKFDLIIRYYIEQREYNIVEIDMTLYEFDQNLLMGKGRHKYAI